ncbi:MAG: helix-hairpin-helix domain-containing protein [Anaerolineales bacterium]
MSCEAEKRRRLIPGWIWTIFVFLPLGMMAYWFLRWFFLPSYKRTASVEIKAPRTRVVKAPLKRDDFQLIKGIGPKTAGVLYQAGIFTFEQLALLDEEKITALVQEHQLPAGKIPSWQQQAALAAAQDWEGLDQLQE